MYGAACLLYGADTSNSVIKRHNYNSSSFTCWQSSLPNSFSAMFSTELTDKVGQLVIKYCVVYTMFLYEFLITSFELLTNHYLFITLKNRGHQNGPPKDCSFFASYFMVLARYCAKINEKQARLHVSLINSVTRPCVYYFNIFLTSLATWSKGCPSDF